MPWSQLQQALGDLPISLTIARMYDILCWTTWKWDILGNRKTTRWVPVGSGFNRETGYVSKTLLDPEQLKRVKIPLPHAPALRSAGFTQKGCIEINTMKEFDRVLGEKNGFIVILDTTGNKIHHVSCRWVNRNGFNEKVIINRKRNGRYFWCKDCNEAKAKYRARDCKTCM